MARDANRRVPSCGGVLMAWIERREVQRPGRSGRTVRYQLRYRDHAGRSHAETFCRLVDADRRKAEIEVEVELVNGTWLDPRRGEVRLAEWAAEWVETRHDLRVTTWARLRTTLARQVLPRFGTTPLIMISNAAVRGWVAEMLDAGLSPATARKAVSALRRCLTAAVADRRIPLNAAVEYRCRRSGPIFRGSCPKPRLNSWPPRCRSGTALWSWSAGTPDCAGARPWV